MYFVSITEWHLHTRGWAAACTEPAWLPCHQHHLDVPPTLLVTVPRKSVQPKQKIQIKAPGRQGKGEGDRFEPKEQGIKRGFSFWDPDRNQMPTAQKLGYHLNSCKQVESKKVFHFVLNWGVNLTPLLLWREAHGLFFKETYYLKDFSAPKVSPLSLPVDSFLFYSPVGMHINRFWQLLDQGLLRDQVLFVLCQTPDTQSWFVLVPSWVNRSRRGMSEVVWGCGTMSMGHLGALCAFPFSLQVERSSGAAGPL